MSRRQPPNQGRQVTVGYVGEFEQLAGKPNHDARRKMRAMERRQTKRTVSRPLTEDRIPPGSLMADETLQLIREGKLVLLRKLPSGFGLTPPKPPKNPSAARRRARRHSGI